MQRDVDLAREILLEMECRTSPAEQVEPISIPGYSSAQVSDHIRLLCDAGYMEAENASSSVRIRWLPKSLTPVAHEFLELCRVDARWMEAKKIVTEQGGPVGFESMKAVLANLAEATPGTGNP